MPPCAAHDLFEGIVPFDLIFCIKHFVSEGWFSYAELNKRIANFRFVGENKQVLPEIKIAEKLTETASEIRRYLMIFPIVTADKVQDFEDDVWKMMLLLREVCNVVCAPAISIQQTIFLQDKITDYLELRITCFPKIQLRPKHHFLVHYPSLIRHFGPLKHMWTLRFESKHSYFKNAVRHCKNFKNITKTLACKHEQFQILCQSKIQYSAAAESNGTVQLDVEKEDSQSFMKYLKTMHHMALEDTNVVFKGIRYTRNMCICVEKNEDDNFILCTIQKILMNSEGTELFFIGDTHHVTYNRDVGVYEPLNIDKREHELDVPEAFQHSRLLSAEPFLQTNIGCIPVYVSKYEPLELKV